MTKLGTKSLTDAFQRGIAITFRGEHIHRDVFICRAEWNENGEAHYAHGKRFSCLSDRKADFIAEQIMIEQLTRWAEKGSSAR